MDAFIRKINKNTTEALMKIKTEADDRYYNIGDPTLTDEQYDFIVDTLKDRDPGISLGIGCKLRDTDNKVKLPYFMGSMEKIKEAKDLTDWIQKNKTTEYLISNKLNGVSCLIIFKTDGKINMFTRGDGEIGCDISYFRDKIKHIPKNIKQDLAVRGEIIITIEKFKSKHFGAFKNPLGLIVGTVNSKTLREPVYDLEFIAYEVLDPIGKTPLENLKLLHSLSFKVVEYTTLKCKDLTIDSLGSMLAQQLSSYAYEIDGLVVYSNTLYRRDNVTPDGNPKYAFAFKAIQEVIDTEVVSVEWNVSKWGYLKPRLCLKPVVLGGSTIVHATASNAKYVVDSNLGPGSIVTITRSGEVIPAVVKVVKATQAQLPEGDNYEWNETHVDLVVKSQNQVNVPLLVHFFTSLGIKQINEGVVSKLVNCGFDTIPKILAMSIEDLKTVPTFKDKMATRIWENIHQNLGSLSLSTVMVASGIFGIGLGLKRAEMLVKAIPDILTRPSVMIKDICQVDGFSDKTAERILNHLSEFKKFYKNLQQYIPVHVVKVTDEPVPKIQDLQGQVFAFTGFRSDEIKKNIISRGGQVSDTLTKAVTTLLCKSLDKPSSKITQAGDRGVTVILVSDFKIVI